MSKPIRVLVADDHAMVREALCAVIASCPETGYLKCFIGRVAK